ncbi:hypothetical protein UlMin_034518 [Ulmus minor]
MESKNQQTPFPTNNENPSKTSQNTKIFNFPFTFLHQIMTNLVIKSKWAELNGAMGDLGTVVPLVLAVTLSKDLNLGTTLIFTRIYNIASGAIYGVPMPVQPMKSIIAVALSNDSNFGIPEIMAAGICTGVIIGVHLAQGLSFALAAVHYIGKVQDFSKPKSWELRHWLGLDGLVLALTCACVVILVDGAGQDKHQSETSETNNDQLSGDNDKENFGKKISTIGKLMAFIPTALVIFVLGIILAFIRRPKVVSDIKFGPSQIQIVKLTKHAWKEGFLKGTIPQLPLIVLNSVISVCKLSSNNLFPDKDFSAGLVSVTVGLMNVLGCCFGAMPCCHGAGGLAAHYKFGGRSGGCFGFGFGTSLAKIMNQFPIGFLGVMLFFAGIELAMASRNMDTMEDCFVLWFHLWALKLCLASFVGFLCVFFLG